MDAIYEKLTIQNDFIFKKVFEDKEMLKKLLKIILPDRDFSDLEIVISESTMDVFPFSKGIRLDIYAEDSTSVLIIEMQVLPYGMDPRRARYYQGMADVDKLLKGMDYHKLKDVITIFICPFDPIGDNMMVNIYKFLNTVTGRDHNDGRTHIYINCAGKDSELYPELKPFADYVMGKMSDDPFVQEVDRRVKMARQNPQWRLEFMTLYEKIRFEKEISRKEGWDEGKILERIDLINRKMAKGRSFEEACELLDLTPEEIDECRKYMDTGLFLALN